jgi:LPS sulfotransferase NodH
VTVVRRPADFIILSTPRSGSNNLQDALHQHPEIDCGGELFNPSHVQIWNRLYMQERASGWVERAGAMAFFAMTQQCKRRFPRAVLRIARRPRGKPLFGFRLFGGHIFYFRLDPFLDELCARGTRFVHLVRRDTFDQAVSLVRAQVTGMWKRRPGVMAPALPLDLLALADRIAAAAEELHTHKLISARAARRYDALLLPYEEYTRDEQSYERIQEFLGVRSHARLRHANLQTPPVDAETYRTLRRELERRGAPLRFDPDSL